MGKWRHHSASELYLVIKGDGGQGGIQPEHLITEQCLHAEGQAVHISRHWPQRPCHCKHKDPITAGRWAWSSLLVTGGDSAESSLIQVREEEWGMKAMSVQEVSKKAQQQQSLSLRAEA